MPAEAGFARELKQKRNHRESRWLQLEYGQTQMNSRKRISWIAALAATLFAGIAVGPAHKRLLMPVRANPAQASQAPARVGQAAPDIVTLVCSEPGTPDAELAVIAVDSTNLQVTLPRVGNNCAQSLRNLYGQGFVRQSYSGGATQWRADIQSGEQSTACYYLTACSVEKTFQWELVRGQ